ncbi:alpha/beta-hydrolase [Cryphonectria parasitica EP155]|uniref:Alpha/beta-hydrolase n=1 Tax=Cryphonectria parasitica (strain ATCC 38755 / EP155) TaxID=660469 RepID=A0A9P4YCQ5_CRYP1|nr:alpha/beta-hydrolase [Cryphonectria parasitica EP155]KAF3771082.1 alpha/beta-hydrolase [Cryphonectria parasitica EP155]
MFENFEPISVQTQSSPEVTIRGLRSTNSASSSSSSSQLPPLLLLHGFPQTLHIWHRIAPRLTDTFTVVLLDLRGYGTSSKPGGDVSQYAKSVMARDCVTVMETLGYKSFYLCGHDRGGRVGHKLCVDHPDRVRRAMFLDICPTLAMYEATDLTFATAYFHWFLLIQPAPLPETMLLSNPRRLAELFMGGRQLGGTGIFEPECFDKYVAGMSDPDCVHAMCEDYRAAATLDLDEQRADLEGSRRIRCPLRVLWGKAGVVEKRFDALREWRKVVEEGVKVDGYAVDSGHYIPEHAPDDVLAAIQEFFVAEEE